MEGHKLATLKPGDVVIAVMGITGSGKSTFISQLVDEDVAIGHNLKSCTANVGVYSFVYKHTQRVFLIDTPGFDDTTRTDTDVLKDIAFFLSHTYSEKIHLTGIIYLHRITDVRMAGSSLRNLNMFKKLCGENAYKHVILVTTMWSNLSGPDLSFETGVKRELELVSSKNFWEPMYARGSKVVRHTGEPESALAIVEALLRHHTIDEPMTLDIQTEMVDKKKTLENTAAGQEVEKELIETKRKHTAQIKELKEGYDKAMQDRDEQLAQALLDQRLEMEDKLRQADEAQKNLKVDFDRLEQEKTAQYNSLYAQLQDEQGKLAALVADRKRDWDEFQIEKQIAEKKFDTEKEAAQKERRRLEKDITNLMEQNKKAEAERAAAEAKRFEDFERKQQQQRQKEQEAMKVREAALETKVSDLKVQLQEKKMQKSRVGSVIAGLTGVASLVTIATGIVTFNPALMMAGAGIGSAALGGAGSSMNGSS